jgi:hypothetical protein
VPEARQRATTSGLGKPNRFPSPTEQTAQRAPVAFTSPGLDPELLPWCGTFTTSAWTRPAKACSPSSPRSPVNRKTVSP